MLHRTPQCLFDQSLLYNYNEVKGIYGMCDECKKYEKKMEEDKEKFDTSNGISKLSVTE